MRTAGILEASLAQGSRVTSRGSSGAGGAILGEVVAGPVGALVGGMATRRQQVSTQDDSAALVRVETAPSRIATVVFKGPMGGGALPIYAKAASVLAPAAVAVERQTGEVHGPRWRRRRVVVRRVSPWTLYRIARRMARASRRRRPPAVAPQQSDAVGTLGVLLVMSAVVAALLQHMALAGALVAPGVFFTAIGVRAQLRAQSALEAAGLPEMDRMDGPTFERRVAALFRAQGYAVQHVGRSGDFGADLVLRRGGEVVVAQCKRYGRPVGVAAVQQVVAARSMYGARGAIVVTNATFTEAAKRLAAANGVRLMDRSAVAQLAPPSAPTSTAQSTTGGAAPGAADPLSMRRLLVSAEAATRLRFAQELAKRLGSTMHVAAAEDGVVTPVALLNCLAELREKDVLAVTDLALLAPATVDVLAETLRSGAVTVTVDIAGKPSRMARVDLPRFALVAGVASDGAAPLALRGLCGAVVRLPSAAVQRAAPTS